MNRSRPTAAGACRRAVSGIGHRQSSIPSNERRYLTKNGLSRGDLADAIYDYYFVSRSSLVLLWSDMMRNLGLGSTTIMMAAA